MDAVGTTLSIGSASLCLVSVQSYGADGGEPVDTTCLSNTAYMTSEPPTLIGGSSLSFTARFDPDALSGLVSEINVQQQMTMTFPSPYGSHSFYGYLRTVQAEEGTFNESWNLTGEIAITNTDSSGAEAGPSI